jgi:hypothetical protein
LDTVLEEVKVKGLKFQLLYCQRLRKDISGDDIVEGVCEFKVVNTSNSTTELRRGLSSEVIDSNGNKHPLREFGFDGNIPLNYSSGEYSITFSNDNYSTKESIVKLYRGVTVRGAIIIKNIFPDNTAFRKISLDFGVHDAQGNKGKQTKIIFGAKPIPILPTKQ